MARWVGLFALILAVSACGGSTNPTADRPAGPTAIPVPPETLTAGTVREMLGPSLDGEGGGYFLFQLGGPLEQDTRAELEGVGVVFYDYISDNAYYVYLPAGSLPVLQELLQEGILRYVGPIPDEAKLDPRLGEKLQADPEQPFSVIVQFFEAPSAADRERLEQWLEISGTSFGPVNIAEGVVVGKDIERILSMPVVKWVEERAPADLGGNR